MLENNNNLNNIQNEPVLPKKKVSFVHVSAPNQPAQANNPQPSQANNPQPASPAQPAPQPAPVQQAQQYNYGAQQTYNPYSQAYTYYPYNQYTPQNYQNPYYYGQYQPYYDPEVIRRQYEHQVKVGEAKKKIKSLGSMAGIAILLFVAASFLVSSILLIPQIKSLYSSSSAFQSAFAIVSSFLYIFIPFGIMAIFIKKKEPDVNFFPFKKMSAKRAVLSVPIGLLICVGANIITNVLINLLDSAGVKATQPSDSAANPETIPALLLSLVATAIMPALLEEFALRGVILQPLRKYGTAFAIVASSAIFGIMHGNLIQAPFAFIVGLGLAFFAIKCGSLWIGVIIHGLNNAYSVLMSFMYSKLSEGTADKINYCVVGAILLLAIVSIVILLLSDKEFFKKENGDISTQDAKLLTSGQKAAAFFLNVPMIISLILMALFTAQYVS